MATQDVEFNEQLVEVRFWKSLLEQVAFSLSGPLYLGLWTSDPASVGGEVPNVEYARQQVTWTRTDSGGSVVKWANANTLQWTAITSFGSITYYVFLDAATKGNVIFVWLSSGDMVGAGRTLRINPGELVIDLEGTKYPTPLT